MDNLQKSELVISKILEALVESGLQYRTALQFKDLDLDAALEPFFEGCCLWLIDEEIVRCTNAHQVIQGAPMVNPVITSRGFALLGQAFACADGDIRVGQAVKEVAKGRASYAGIGDFFGGLLGGFTKSMGS
ncbi:hypothetical protein [Ruegeria arenilitoris]|uniref:hypothetical protein n=1 Tax=Ruegeria arenilitoris TaxID=1173585 RepID=UPI001CFE6DC3|nr:hypothetical protein [Ruegeria arenilitoris]